MFLILFVIIFWVVCGGLIVFIFKYLEPYGIFKNPKKARLILTLVVTASTWPSFYVAWSLSNFILD